MSPVGSASRLGRGPDCGAALGTVCPRPRGTTRGGTQAPPVFQGVRVAGGGERLRDRTSRDPCIQLPALSPGRAWLQAGVCHETPPSFIPVHVLHVCGVPTPLPRVPGPASSRLSGGHHGPTASSPGTGSTGRHIQPPAGAFSAGPCGSGRVGPCGGAQHPGRCLTPPALTSAPPWGPVPLHGGDQSLPAPRVFSPPPSEQPSSPSVSCDWLLPWIMSVHEPWVPPDEGRAGTWLTASAQGTVGSQ